MRKLFMKFAPAFFAVALAVGFLSTEVAQAHYSTTDIASYHNSVPTGHSNTSTLDAACGSTYRLTNKTWFNEVTDSDAEIHKTSVRSHNYSGEPTGGTYRLGNYNNQTMVIQYFMLNTPLEHGEIYVTSPHLNKTVPFAWNN